MYFRGVGRRGSKGSDKPPFQTRSCKIIIVSYIVNYIRVAKPYFKLGLKRILDYLVNIRLFDYDFEYLNNRFRGNTSHEYVKMFDPIPIIK